MKRLIKGIAGLVALVALIIGVPVLLISIAGNPLPSHVPALGEIRRTIVQGDFNTQLLISIVAMIGWLLWLLAVWSIVWEFGVNMPRLLKGQALRTGPAIPAPLGRLAATLMISVVALVTPMKGIVSAAPLPPPAPVTTTQQVVAPAPAVAPVETQTQTPTTTTTPTWVVEKGDTLWGIAAESLGDGARVDDIVRLNPGVSASAVLSVGTVLQLPSDAVVDASHTAPPATAVADTEAKPTEVTVERGDTLWDLTQEQTGDVDMPTVERIADANSIDNPDLIFPDQVISFASEMPESTLAPVPSSATTDQVSSNTDPSTDVDNTVDTATDTGVDTGTETVDTETETVETETGVDAELPADTQAPLDAGTAVGSGAVIGEGAELAGPAATTPSNTTDSDTNFSTPTQPPIETTLPPPTTAVPTTVGSSNTSDPSRVTQRATFPSVRWMVGGGAIGSLALAGAWMILQQRRQRRRTWMQVQEAPEHAPIEREDVKRVLTRAELTTALMGADGETLRGSRGLVVGDDEVELLRRDEAPAPHGWSRSAAGWMSPRPVDASPLLGDAMATVGVDDEGTEVLIDVLAAEAVAVTGDRAAVEALLCAMVFELAASSRTKIVMAGLSCLAAAETPAQVDMVDVNVAAELMASRSPTDQPMVVIIDPFADESVGLAAKLRSAANSRTALIWAGPLPDAVETIEVPNRSMVRWAGFELSPMGLSEDNDRELSVVLDAVSVGKGSQSTHRERPFDAEAAAIIAREANEFAVEGNTSHAVAVLDRGDEGGPFQEVDEPDTTTIPVFAPRSTDGGADPIEPDEPSDEPTEPFVSSVNHPMVLMRACTSKVTAVGAALGDSQVEAAAIFVLAAAGRPVASAQMAERLECSPKTLANVISTEHPLVIRDDGQLRLRDGVVTDYEWCRQTARGLAEAITSNDESGHQEWLQLTNEALLAIELAPFSTVPTTKRSGKVWQWVDEWPEGNPARWGAESDIAQAALGFATVWPVVDGDRWIERERIVAQLCRLAGIVPNAVVRPISDSIWSNSGEALLEAAMSIASIDHALVKVVHNAARVMVSRHQIEASDELAEQLGL